MCLGAIWVKIAKSQSETDQSRGKEAASGGSYVITNKTAFSTVISLINLTGDCLESQEHLSKRTNHAECSVCQNDIG